MVLTQDTRRPNFLVIVADDLGISAQQQLCLIDRLFGYFAVRIRDFDSRNSTAIGRRSSIDSVPHRIGMFPNQVNALVWDG